jgi:hypothetical protein
MSMSSHCINRKFINIRGHIPLGLTRYALK